MADVEASTADVVGLVGGGHFVVLTDTGAMDAKRLPVSAVAVAVALAETAIQADVLGSAAYLDAAEFAPASVAEDIATALEAITGGGPPPPVTGGIGVMVIGSTFVVA
jgi:hypothetical protein